MMMSSTAVATYELSTSISTVVMPIATYIFLKKLSLEQIYPFDILHNTIEHIDPFN
jgi:hypothetical protein